jgi:hypothetical protein
MLMAVISRLLVWLGQTNVGFAPVDRLLYNQNVQYAYAKRAYNAPYPPQTVHILIPGRLSRKKIEEGAIILSKKNPR